MEHVKSNLRQIIKLAEEMQIPTTMPMIIDLAKNALHVTEMGDREKQRMGLALATLVKAVRHNPNSNSPDFEDLALLNFVAKEAAAMFPPEEHPASA